MDCFVTRNDSSFLKSKSSDNDLLQREVVVGVVALIVCKEFDLILTIVFLREKSTDHTAQSSTHSTTSEMRDIDTFDMIGETRQILASCTKQKTDILPRSYRNR